jgi:two-component system phosphate regulon response regulator PhoB
MAFSAGADMQHEFEKTATVVILTENADYFAILKHILCTEGIQAVLCDKTDIDDKSVEPDVLGLILDVKTNGEDARIICKRIKTKPATRGLRVLAIIPNGDTDTYMAFMRAGADQCLIRPFWPPHLLTFLNDIKSEPADRKSPRSQDLPLKLGDIELWPERRRATVNGVELFLGPIEFKLLEHLLSEPGRIFSRGDLIAAAWPDAVYVQPRTVDVHIGRIRRQLKKVTGADTIRTARSSGYAIEIAISRSDAA